jgi:rhodanese-related sulfurtransferase
MKAGGVMSIERAGLQEKSLFQQGYDRTPAELKELRWGLRFTPLLCMAVAVVGLVTRQPLIHYTLAVLGIVPFWIPAGHPLDLFYNTLLRPLWKGVKLPPNPLPRRIACVMGGLMNLGIGLAFSFQNLALAYVLGTSLIALQIVVISTHFCLASWIYEIVLKGLGRFMPPIEVERAKELIGNKAYLIDVRNPDEFAREHLPGAYNVPLDRVAKELTKNEDTHFVVYCASGCRSQEAVQLLKKQGFDNVYNFGSMFRWE